MHNTKIYRYTPNRQFQRIIEKIVIWHFLSLSQWIREHGSHDPGQNHAEDCAKIKGLNFNHFQCSRPFIRILIFMSSWYLLIKTVERNTYLYKNNFSNFAVNLCKVLLLLYYTVEYSPRRLCDPVLRYLVPHNLIPNQCFRYREKCLLAVSWWTNRWWLVRWATRPRPGTTQCWKVARFIHNFF